MKTYRVVISIRARGQTPFDQKEKRSEDYDNYDDFAEAAKQFVLDNIADDLEQDEDNEGDYDETDVTHGV